MSIPTDRRFRAALVQLRAGRTIAPNLEAAEALIREAARGGAQYVQTPENTALMELEPALVLAQASPEASSEPLQVFCALAAELGIWLHVGSLGIQADDTRVANRSFLIDPKGAIAARYDKLHMFDVDLAGGESYRESQYYAPGSKAVVADLPWGRLGMTVCYDLRFPALYRALADDVIRGAAVDVTDPEPLPRDHPLLALDNVTIMPHLGSATIETRREMARNSVENLMRGLRGEPLLNQVRP